MTETMIERMMEDGKCIELSSFGLSWSAEETAKVFIEVYLEHRDCRLGLPMSTVARAIRRHSEGLISGHTNAEWYRLALQYCKDGVFNYREFIETHVTE